MSVTQRAITSPLAHRVLRGKLSPGGGTLAGEEAGELAERRVAGGVSVWQIGLWVLFSVSFLITSVSYCHNSGLKQHRLLS